MGAQTGKDLYDGEAAFGRFNSTIGAVIGTIMGVLMFLGGVAMMFVNTSKNKTKTNAYVDAATCTISAHTCEVDLHYSTSGKLYQAPHKSATDCPSEQICSHMAMSTNTAIVPGQILKVQYDNDATSMVELATTNSVFKIVGGILLLFAVLLVGGSWLSYYTTHRFKIAAAATGTGATLGLALGRL